MSNLSDSQLLQLTSSGDDLQRRSALEALVRRELDFVYSAAVRQANFDRHLAQDITQAVFILLARKAGKLRHDVILRDWLFVTTRYAAKNALKIEARRRYHEQRAAAERAVAVESTDESLQRERLAPLIDEAVSRLSGADRAGVLLSFFDNKTHREVGQQLGISEDAARKRIVRAIDKMRSFFASRGVTIDSAAGAIAVSSALRASAGAVPSALANSVLDVALSISASSTTTSSFLLAKGASKMFLYAKLKLAAAAVAASVIVGGSSVALFGQAGTGAKPAAPPAKAPAPAQVDNATAVARFDDGIAVECLGIRRMGDKDDAWWYPDGSPSPHSADPPQTTSQPPFTHQLLFRVSGVPDDAGTVYYFGKDLNWSSEEAHHDGGRIEGGLTIALTADEHRTLSMTCMIATGPWESVLTCEHLDSTTVGAGKHGGVIFSPIVNAPNPYNNNQPGAHVTVSHDVSKDQVRVLGVDDNGVEHVPRTGEGAMAGAVRQTQYHFDMPVENLRTVSFQVRPYEHRVTFDNVTLDPATKTDVKIKAEKD